MLLPRRFGLFLATLALGPLLALQPYAPQWLHATGPSGPAASATPDSGTALAVALGVESFGRSGSLRTRVAHPGEDIALRLDWATEPPELVRYLWRPVLGTSGDGDDGYLEPGDIARAPTRPGVYELVLRNGIASHQFGDAFRVVVTVPFDRKRRGPTTWARGPRSPRPAMAPTPRPPGSSRSRRRTSRYASASISRSASS